MDGGYADCGELTMVSTVRPDCIDQRLLFLCGILAAVCERMVDADAGVYGLAAETDDRGVREPVDGVNKPELSVLRFFFGRRKV